MLVVAALGGNALLKRGEPLTARTQRANVRIAAQGLAAIVRAGHDLVITHGNGPQVGNLLVKNELAAHVVPPVPLDWCGAQTQGTLGFTILTPLPIEMRAGALIDYRIRLNGIPMRWRTAIESFDPPNSFVDTQAKGPYAHWHHTHTFRDVPGGTEIGDRVRYALPFGSLGRIAHVLVKRQLKTIFDYRTRIMRELFGCQ